MAKDTSPTAPVKDDPGFVEPLPTSAPGPGANDDPDQPRLAEEHEEAATLAAEYDAHVEADALQRAEVAAREADAFHRTEVAAQAEACHAAHYGAEEAMSPAVTNAHNVWLVQDLIPFRGVAVLAGYPKTCKSTIALSIALHCASDTKFAGQKEVAHVKPLIISAEMGHVLTYQRMWSICRPLGLDLTEMNPIVLRDDRPVDLSDKDSMVIIKTICKIEGCNLIVLDPFGWMLNVDENDATAVGRVMQRIKGAVDEMGISCLIVHHARKGAGKGHHQVEASDVRGSSAIYAGVDSLLTLNTVEENGRDPDIVDVDIEGTHRRCHGTKMRLRIIHEAELATSAIHIPELRGIHIEILTSPPPGPSREEREAARKMVKATADKAKRDELLALLSRHPEGINQSSLARSLGIEQSKSKCGDLSADLRTLKADGLAAFTSGPSGSKIWRAVDPQPDPVVDAFVDGVAKANRGAANDDS